MGIYTYSLDDEIAEEFNNKTPAQKTSKEVENLMREYLEKEKGSEGIILYDLNELTKNRKELAEFIIENEETEFEKPELFKKVNRKAIYAQKESFKNALRKFDNSEEVPIGFEEGKVVMQKIECRSCDGMLNKKLLKRSDLQCPGCGQKYEV